MAPRPIAVDAFSPLSNLSAILTNAVAPPTPRPVAVIPAAAPPTAASPRAAANDPAIANRNLCEVGLFLANSPYLANFFAMSGCLAANFDLTSSHLASKSLTGCEFARAPPSLLYHMSLSFSLTSPAASTALPAIVRLEPCSLAVVSMLLNNCLICSGARATSINKGCISLCQCSK